MRLLGQFETIVIIFLQNDFERTKRQEKAPTTTNITKKHQKHKKASKAPKSTKTQLSKSTKRK